MRGHLKVGELCVAQPVKCVRFSGYESEDVAVSELEFRPFRDLRLRLLPESGGRPEFHGTGHAGSVQ